MKKKFFAVGLILLGALVFAGGSKDKSGVTLVKVGTEGAYPPYNYVTETGEADGYDVAVVRAVDELIPEYRFEFIPTAW
jgi:L-cystine transport system substrate-binding protein